MYSDEELDAAAAAGAISAESVAAFRRFVGGYRTAPDEEQFRLLTGFNDIFIAIAVIVFLIAVAWLAARVSMLAGGAAVAGLSWGLAEYFTRQRRLALPSIVLALGFILGAAFLLTAAVDAAITGLGGHGIGGARGPDAVAVISALLAGVIYAHWRRFHVPITVALCATSTIGALLWLLIGFFPSLKSAMQPLLLLGGLVLFAAAMSWDMRDPLRTTRRTDIAFWLHLAAAPLIVHGVFALFGVLTPGGAQPGRAALVIGMYLLMTCVALIIDRRALLTAALAYVLYAMSSIIRNAGSPTFSFALSGFVIGAGLLTLSAFWHPARAFLVSPLPARLRANLPPVERVRKE
jgi:hypothetical protein